MKQSTLPSLPEVAERELLTERLELRVPPSLRKEILAHVQPGKLSMNQVVLRAVRAGLSALQQESHA